MFSRKYLRKGQANVFDMFHLQKPLKLGHLQIRFACVTNTLRKTHCSDEMCFRKKSEKYEFDAFPIFSCNGVYQELISHDSGITEFVPANSGQSIARSEPQCGMHRCCPQS